MKLFWVVPVALLAFYCAVQAAVDATARLLAIWQGNAPYPPFTLPGWVGLALVTFFVVRGVLLAGKTSADTSFTKR